MKLPPINVLIDLSISMFFVLTETPKHEDL